MQIAFKTDRLLLTALSLDDAIFIFELVNTAEWIQFIGNRKVEDLGDAKAYIQKLIDNPTINYWVVKLQNDGQSIGVITLLKRDYLEHPDIGFAFLPRFSHQGYAFEASSVVLKKLLESTDYQYILAATLPENANSIKLLEKLGLHFEKEFLRNNDTLRLYSTPAKT